jgi:NADH-quinone oxidoreductase subunit A
VTYLAPYATFALLLVLGIGFFAVSMTANRLLRPHQPSPAKLSTYECGVDPVGRGWAQVHIRYYVFAYLYVLFAVEAVFLFPWAVVFAAPGFGASTLAEMGVFAGLLALGLLYAWRRGVLRWL